MEQSPSWEANGSQLVKKFPAFYGTRMFITAFTSVRQLSLSWASSIQSITPHPIFLKIPLNIIHTSMPESTKWSLSLRFPHQNPVYSSPLPHTRYMPRQSHSSRFDHRNDIWWAIQIIKLHIMQFSPLPCYIVPLRPKYSPQHPVLKHPQATFLPQCKRQSFTPTQNDRQNYSFVYLNL